jgi:hypothetical protein
MLILMTANFALNVNAHELATKHRKFIRTKQED